MNLIIVDNHKLFLNALVNSLKTQDGIDEIFAFIQLDLTELLQVIAEKQIDLVILDINLNGVDGFIVGENIRNKFPEIPIAFLTGHGNQLHLINQAIEFDAEGFFTKDMDLETLVQEIKKAIKGGKPGLAVLQEDAPSLTKQEMKALFLFCRGYTNQDMAKELSLSVRQVERYKKQIFVKFCVKNEKEAIRKALELGYELIP